MTRAINGAFPPMWQVGNFTVNDFLMAYCTASIRTGVINFRSTLSEYQVWVGERLY